MQGLLDLFSTPWVGTILAIISLITALYFYIKAKSTPRLAYQVEGVSIVGGSRAAFPNELEIRFADVVVPKVTSTRVVLWNAGNTTIRGDQIVSSDPLRIEFPDGTQVLRSTLLAETRAVNASTISPSSNTLIISFDYFDPGDGVAIGAYHSGDKDRVKCLGTIRGTPQGLVNYGRLDSRSKGRLPHLSFPLNIKVLSIIMLIFGILMLVTGLFFDQIFIQNEDNERPLPELGYFFAGMGAVYVVMPMLMLWRIRRRFPRVLDEVADSNLSPRPS